MAQDDLVRLFWQRAPERIAEITDLWIRVEQGEVRKKRALLRALHTVKGEAHMLALPFAQLLQLMEYLAKVGPDRAPESASEAIFAGLDLLGMFASQGDDDEEIDMEVVRDLLLQACEEAGEIDTLPASPEVSEAKVADGDRASAEAALEEGGAGALPSLDPMALHPLVHDALRLHREQASLRPALREIRRMLRALLAEIDPQLSPDALAERIVKTLGYGTEVERRIGGLYTQWSAHDFALGRALEAVQDTVRDAAMVPLTQLKSAIHRNARAVARALDKEVDVEIVGDVFLESAVEEALGPVLLHLVRNAIDHGLEDSATRIDAGKPPVGKVLVDVSQSGSNVRVVVADDGAGIDVEAIRWRLGRDRSDAQHLDEQALLQEIFTHGMSTREEITDISGRGIGLDIVAGMVNKLGGRLNVETGRGFGTAFELELPAMLQADRVVILGVSATRCAIPARQVVEIVRDAPLIMIGEHPHLQRGEKGSSELVPVFTLHEAFDQRHSLSQREILVVLRHQGGLLAIAVDSYSNPQDLSFQRVEELPFRSELVRGIAPAPDGGVLLLLDVDALQRTLRGVESSEQRRRGQSAEREAAHVLVVEDAPVARELLLGVLRSFGLRVSDAADGRQGLLKARADLPDLILTDVEMPFLGGLEMVAELRADARLRTIPVIVLTTRDDPIVRRKAESLAVAGFLSKQRFVEDELRTMIDACLETR